MEITPPADWQYLLILVVPGIVAWVKAKLPKWALPILAALLGAGLQALAGWADGTSWHPLAGAALGGLAVFVREVYDQLRKAIAPA